MVAAATVGGLGAYAWSGGSDESSLDPATVARDRPARPQPATGEPELAGIDAAQPGAR